MINYTKHETAIVDPGAIIGEGTKIWHWSHICGKEVSVGKNCSFGQNVYIGNRVRIGNNVRVQNNVSVYDCVTLEDDVFCGPSMVFTNVINPRSHVPRKDEFKTTLVKKGATLGANCTIVCGVTLGRFSFIAAGAVITQNVADFALMMGVPGRHVGWMCHCGVRLKAELGETADASKCASCGSTYKIHGPKCQEIELKSPV